MKQKIKEALKTRAKNLGLDDSAFDGVAAFGETIVKEEADIENFVNSEATLNLLKTYQSVADKARAAAKAKNEPEIKPSENGNQPNPNPEPPKVETPDFKAMLADALAEVVNPLKEELAGLKAEKAKETAVAALDKFVSEWDYAKGFPKESELSKRIALKVYKAGGEKMTGEELIAAFREEFDPAVQQKGVTDFSKPFDSNGGGKDDDLDMKSVMEIYKKSGRVADGKE